MDYAEQLEQLGWSRIEGAALARAAKATGNDWWVEENRTIFARKFSRKTVFLRYTNACRPYIPMDRDDPALGEDHGGVKLYIRWCDIETVNQGAEMLVNSFHELVQVERGGATSDS